MDKDSAKFDSPFYRVSVKALIFDDQGHILVFKDNLGDYEMPGGGWEHEEADLEECLRRELKEEANVELVSIGNVEFVYKNRHKHGYYKLCIAVRAELRSLIFKMSADDLVEARFVDKQEFLNLQWAGSERFIVNLADRIWPLERVPAAQA
jgi:8-oxo-dGTP pyrophosphatase MutT (NUDIX family)